MTTGFFHKGTIKQAIWKANDKEVKEMVTRRPIVMGRWDYVRQSRDYTKQVNLYDTLVWVRYRSRMKVRVKANRSSAFRKNGKG